MKRQVLFLITTLLLSISISGCGKQEFATQKTVETIQSPAITHKTVSACSTYSVLKPNVDFLFLWDNSSSFNYAKEGTKKALSKTIENISSRFNYRILIAPILIGGSDQLASASIVASDPNGISSSLQSKIIAKDQAIASLDSMPTSYSGSTEPGFERANSLLEAARTNGIFRTSSYLIIVLASNGDDIGSGGSAGCGDFSSYGVGKANMLISTASQMTPQQFRMMTLVPHSGRLACPDAGNTCANTAYKAASRTIWQSAGAPAQAGVADSYDICGKDFSHILDGVNQSIQETIQNHKYDHWPIITLSNEPAQVPFDINQIKVFKDNGTELLKDDSNGFQYVGFKTNFNTRYFPTAGEPATGYFIKLKGTGEIKYPECIQIKTQSPLEYYGYIQMHSKPQIDSIILTINGVVIPQSATNGWTLIDGYRNNQNVIVTGPGNETPALPAKIESGYFLQLHGTAIYSNGASINVEYLPVQI